MARREKVNEFAYGEVILNYICIWPKGIKRELHAENNS
jgi:hypothetical protein